MRRFLPWVGVAVALVALALFAGGPGDDGPPLDPNGTGPLGTRALVLLLEGAGADVDVTSRADADDHDVALLLRDDLDELERRRLADFVGDGGTLVVTDPGSPLAAFTSGDDFFGGLVDATIGRRTCDVAALADLDRVDPSGGLPFQVLPGDRSCFGDGDTAFVVVSDERAGTVVSVGGAGVFTNGTLGQEDNAALAVSLIAPEPGTRIAFVEPDLLGGGDDSLADLVSDGVKLGLVQLGVAFVVYALWRSIRLGRPVAEGQPVEIASSEFVRAVGDLLAERRDPALSARAIARHAQRDLAAAVGLGPGAEPPAVSAAVAARTGLEAADVARLLAAADVTSDDDLVAFTHRIDRLREELLRDEPTTA